MTEGCVWKLNGLSAATRERYPKVRHLGIEPVPRSIWAGLGRPPRLALQPPASDDPRVPDTDTHVPDEHNPGDAGLCPERNAVAHDACGVWVVANPDGTGEPQPVDELV